MSVIPAVTKATSGSGTDNSRTIPPGQARPAGNSGIASSMGYIPNGSIGSPALPIQTSAQPNPPSQGISGLPLNPKRIGAPRPKGQPKSGAVQLNSAGAVRGIQATSGGGLPSQFKLQSPAIHIKHPYFKARSTPHGSGPLLANIDPSGVKGDLTGLYSYLFPNVHKGQGSGAAKNLGRPITSARDFTPIKTLKKQTTGFHTDRGGSNPQ